MPFLHKNLFDGDPENVYSHVDYELCIEVDIPSLHRFVAGDEAWRRS